METKTGNPDEYTVSYVLKQHNFSCNYNSEKIFIQIHNAKGIAAKDLDGLSDPFVIVHFINKYGSEEKESLYQTAVIPNTLNPVWDYETCSLNCQNRGGCSKYNIDNWKEIVFEIRDKDILRTQFIGQCRVDVNHITSKTTRKTYKLESRPDKNDKVSGTIDISLHYQNQIIERDLANEAARRGLESKQPEISELIKHLTLSEDKAAFIDELAKIDTVIDGLRDDKDDRTSTSYELKRKELAKQVVDKVMELGAYRDIVTDKRIIYKVIWDPLRIRFASQAKLNDENFSNPKDPILFSFCYPPSMEVTEELAKTGFAKQFLKWIEDGDQELREDMKQFYTSHVLELAEYKHGDGDQAVKAHYGYHDHAPKAKHHSELANERYRDAQMKKNLLSFAHALNTIDYWFFGGRYGM